MIGVYLGAAFGGGLFVHLLEHAAVEKPLLFLELQGVGATHLLVSFAFHFLSSSFKYSHSVWLVGKVGRLSHAQVEAGSLCVWRVAAWRIELRLLLNFCWGFLSVSKVGLVGELLQVANARESGVQINCNRDAAALLIRGIKSVSFLPGRVLQKKGVCLMWSTCAIVLRFFHSPCSFIRQGLIQGVVRSEY